MSVLHQDAVILVDVVLHFADCHPSMSKFEEARQHHLSFAKESHRDQRKGELISEASRQERQEQPSSSQHSIDLTN